MHRVAQYWRLPYTVLRQTLLCEVMATHVATYAVSRRRKLTIRMNSTTLPSTPYGVPHNDVGSSQFLWTHFVIPHGSNPDYTHPLCLCGDKGSNLGYGIRSEERTNTARYLTTGVAQL